MYYLFEVIRVKLDFHIWWTTLVSPHPVYKNKSQTFLFVKRTASFSLISYRGKKPTGLSCQKKKLFVTTGELEQAARVSFNWKLEIGNCTYLLQ